MADVIIIAGETSSGKSRSLKNLDINSTYILNCVSKLLPWKGSVSDFNSERKNLFNTDKYTQIAEVMIKIDRERPEIKTIIVDDAGFIMTAELFQRASETGYNKFTDIGKHMQDLFKQAKSLRNDLNVVFIFHTEIEKSDFMANFLKVKTIGQMLDDKYNPLSVVTIAIIAHVSIDEQGKPNYRFITNRTMIDGYIVPAKSPEGMFPDTFMENDLQVLLQLKEDYYK